MSINSKKRLKSVTIKLIVIQIISSKKKKEGEINLSVECTVLY